MGDIDAPQFARLDINVGDGLTPHHAPVSQLYVRTHEVEYGQKSNPRGIQPDGLNS